MTVSPNRRHSALILRLSRARRNDPALAADTATAKARRRHAGADSPPLLIDGDVEDAAEDDHELRPNVGRGEGVGEPQKGPGGLPMEVPDDLPPSNRSA